MIKQTTSSFAGRHYTYALTIPGYGNEMLITGIPGVTERSGNQKTITRSSIDRVLAIALKLRSEGKDVTGPKMLHMYGTSYIFAVFQVLGVEGERGIDGVVDERVDASIGVVEHTDGQMSLKL